MVTGDEEHQDEKVGVEVLFEDRGQAPPSPCPIMLVILGIPLHTMPCVTAGAGLRHPIVSREFPDILERLCASMANSSAHSASLEIRSCAVAFGLSNAIHHTSRAKDQSGQEYIRFL